MRCIPLTFDLHFKAAALFIDVFAAPPWCEMWTISQVLRRFDELTNTPASIGIVVVDSEAVIGLAIGVGEERHDGRLFQIREFCVAERARRRGLGINLLSSLAEKAAQQGATQLALSTTRGMPAETFYSNHGFSLAENEVFMTRALPLPHANGSYHLFID